MKKWLPEIRRGESGQAFILVLVMLVLGSLVIVPSLTLASTNLKTGQMVEENMKGIYAADAGTEDAMWRIVNDPPASYPYNYEITGINGMSVSVVIEEVTSINGQVVEPPAGHVDWLDIIKSVYYDTGIYFYGPEISPVNIFLIWCIVFFKDIHSPEKSKEFISSYSFNIKGLSYIADIYSII